MATNPSKSVSIRIDTNGLMTMIYDDEMADFIQENNATVSRASHVEPVVGGWAADLSPVGGPTLGPFTLRQEALSAEIAWLKENIIYG